MNPKRPWLKLYNSLSTDSAVQALSHLEFKVWIFTLIAANVEGRNGLVRDAVNTIASLSTTRRDAVANALGSLQDREMIARSSRDITVKHWSRYQAPAPMTRAETADDRSRDNAPLELEKEREEKYMPSQAEQNAMRKQAEDIFASVTGLSAPTRKKEAGELWWVPLRELCTLAQWKPDWTERLIRRSIDELKASGMNIGSPKSLVKQARSIVAKANMNAQKPDTNGKDRDIVGWDRFTGEVLYS